MVSRLDQVKERVLNPPLTSKYTTEEGVKTTLHNVDKEDIEYIVFQSEKLEEVHNVLLDLKKHQEIVCKGTGSKLSTTYILTEKAISIIEREE